MKYIPCTIRFLREPAEQTWAITVPAAVVDTAAGLISELLNGTRKRLVFLDQKSEFAVTADFAAYNGHQIPISRDFLECLEKLFSTPFRPGINHIDFECSDNQGNVNISIFIQSFLISHS